MKHARRIAFAAAAGLALAAAALAQTGHDHSHAPAPDGRMPVKFPPALKEHTLANMRDHLLSLAEIQDALGKGEYDNAGRIAEARLGMTSLPAHGAHEVAKYMPQGMQDAGSAMHRGASRFAIELQKTAVTGDLKPALGALAETTRACVACHSAYRLE